MQLFFFTADPLALLSLTEEDVLLATAINFSKILLNFAFRPAFRWRAIGSKTGFIFLNSDVELWPQVIIPLIY